MARVQFGGTAADVVLDKYTGRPVPNTEIEVRDADTDVLLTDLTAPPGYSGLAFPAGRARADVDGLVTFLGPDGFTGDVEIRAVTSRGAGAWVRVPRTVPAASVDALTTRVEAVETGKVATTDPRLTDARVPVDGSVTDTKVAAGAGIAVSKLAGLAPVATSGSASDLAAGTVADARLPGRLSDATLNATYARPVANTVIPVGDSITAQDSKGTQYANGTNGYGYLAWANVFAQRRLRVLRNAGVAGERTDQMLARLQADVLAHSPGYVVVECGINDILQDVALATIQANLTSIYTACLNAGARVIATTITPHNTLTAAQKTLRTEANRWIATKAATTRGVALCDWLPYIEDLAVPHAWVSGYAADGIHPSQPAALRMGQALGDVFSRMAPPVGSLANADIVSANIAMTGTGGQKDANATGSVASSFALWTSGGTTGTATASKVPRTDGKQGEKQRVVVAAGNDRTWYLQQQLAAPGATYQVGEWLHGEAEIDLGGDWVTPSRLYLDLNYAGVNILTADLWVSSGEAAMGYAPNVSGLVLRTPPFQVPASGVTATQVRIWFKNAGGTIDVSRMHVGRVPAP